MTVGANLYDSERMTLAELVEAAGPADDQVVPWKPDRWIGSTTPEPRPSLASNQALHRLVERASTRGVRRDDVTSVSTDPIDLLVASMVWGFGPLGYGPSRTERMLSTDGAAEITAEIVDQVRTRGAGQGFSVLFKANGAGRLFGLGVAMGSKLLYFAGRELGSAPARGHSCTTSGSTLGWPYFLSRNAPTSTVSPSHRRESR